jgi:hypothetical protein
MAVSPMLLDNHPLMGHTSQSSLQDEGCGGSTACSFNAQVQNQREPPGEVSRQAGRIGAARRNDVAA